MSQLISSFPIGTIFYQSGYGYPTHIATIGCTYIDVETGTMYINKDGIVNWSEFSGNPFDYIHFNSGQTATYNGGDLFWVDSENALSYKPYTINNDVTVNLGQENLIRVFNQTGSQINNGKAVIITGASSNIGAISLAIASDGNNTLFSVSGIATHDIPNNSYGFITQFGNVNDIDLSSFQLGQTVYLSQTVAGDLVSYNDLYFTGRTSEIGVVLNNSINGRLKVSITNENPFSNITQLESNILNANTLSTGLFDFSGITIQSPTTFNVGQAKGWVVDNISNPIKPTINYVEFNGLSGQTTPYLNTNPITYILLTTGSTLTLQPTPPTSKQRRQNLYLGKLGHANLTTIIQAFNEPDVEESPLAQVRDMFQPIRLINNGVYPSPNGVNLNFNTSAGLLYGFGINFINDNFTPNALSVSGQSPTTFQYRTQTGGTGTNITTIDPNNYDNNGVITTVGGGTNRSTNQRVFLTQNGTIRLQYGQQIYADLPTAISASQTETFNTFSNFRDNAVLIGILSVRHTATDLSDTNYAKFLFASKFGETIGGAGGVSTTNLQQAYNNSTTPEIVINAILDGLSIKNGTGNADNVTNLLEGINTADNTTSFIRADGTISGTTLLTNGFRANNNGITATTISATSISLPFSSGSTLFAGTSGQISQNNSQFFWDNVNNRLGIGTNAPTTTIDAVGNEFRFAAASGAINFYNTPGVNQHFNFINVRQDSDYIFKQNRGGAVNTTSLLIKGNTGNVLINTTTDAGFRLDVNGTARVSGQMSVNGYTISSPASGTIKIGTSPNTTGTNVTAFGQGAIITNAYTNSAAFGESSLGIGTGAGNRVVGVGYLAGYSNSGSFNTYLGGFCGWYQTTGTNNVFVGDKAGELINSGAILAIANSSIFLGQGTRALADNQTNQIVIGQGAIGLGSNTTVLGNSSTTFTSIYGNTGIGTTTNAGFKLDVNGTTRVSALTQNILTVIGSGNSTTSPIFSVQGSQGELFSVTDSLTGSLFSVNDISGLPILEVFSDNTTLMGNYLAPSLNTTARVTLTAGTNTIYSIPVSAYTGAFFDYTVASTGTTGVRAGTIMSVWSGSTAEFTDISTNDIGVTTGVTFSVTSNGTLARLSSSATTTGWIVKTIIRSI